MTAREHLAGWVFMENNVELARLEFVGYGADACHLFKVVPLSEDADAVAKLNGLIGRPVSENLWYRNLETGEQVSDGAFLFTPYDNERFCLRDFRVRSERQGWGRSQNSNAIEAWQ